VAIPDLPGFERLLSTLSATPPLDLQGYTSELVGDGGFAVDRGRRVPQAEQRLWLTPSEEISFEAVLKRVQNELRNKGHVAGRTTALALLHNYALLPRPAGTAVALLNEIIATVVDCDITQVFVLPVPPPPDFHFRVGQFEIGPLNAQRLADRCRRASSDYFERYGDDLNGGLAVERDYFRAKVIDWKRYVPALRAGASTPTTGKPGDRPIVENYFQSVAAELYADFWDQLHEDQLLTLAVGSTFFDGSRLRLLPFTSNITIILNAGPRRWGYVAPNSSTPSIDLASTNKHIPEAVSTLARFGITATEQNELYASLTSFGRFVGRARQHWWDGRQEEGFLHFIIALDLLLGEKDSATDAVAGRTAVLVHGSQGKSFDEQFKLMSRLYDKRSRYVHQGRPVEKQDVELADAICKEVVCCLLRMHRKGRGGETGIIVRWHKDLDYLRSAIEAGRSPSEHEFTFNGIRLVTGGGDPPC
jgi:hypothetical protein